MRTLLIRGESDPPTTVREIVASGSTSVDEVSTRDLATFVSREGFGVDRVVVWAAPDDRAVRALATNYAADAATPGEMVYVTPADCRSSPVGVQRERCLSWPDDEDKLRLLFQTGG
jgi:hypothetical protein